MTREDADAQTRPLCPVSGGPVTLAEGGTVKAMGDLGGGPGVVVVIRPRYRSQARCTCGWLGKTRLLLSSARVEALIHAAQTDCEPAIPLVQSWAVPIKPFSRPTIRRARNVRALTHTGVHFAPSRPWPISARSFWCDPRFGVTAACGREVRRRPNPLLGDTNRDSTESRPSSAVAGTGSVLNKTRVDSQRVHPATTDARVNTVSSAMAGPPREGGGSDEPAVGGPDDDICHCLRRDGV